jgi:transcriptional regulator with XRE-family HTH domain
MITQQELAAKAGITISTLSRLENTKTRPRIRTLRAVAHGLGIDPAELRGMLEVRGE